MTNVEVIWFIYYNGQTIAVVFLKLFLHVDVLQLFSIQYSVIQLYFSSSDICADHSWRLGVEGRKLYPENSNDNVKYIHFINRFQSFKAKLVPGK